ncbi:helix-turn-helix transcriptional regulator [Oligosphaera ethanolica]|jgi:y4mF family transcriptional regulator|uniref:Y4mF family transcriptional regulator n=1 Tax=Oligosphaera ethanolica TaxID=760260 RepID=A0AAE3VJQ4_9BACT|nr:helix-turn-helix transcriptional regulator [Oligosphaera ethanolica]MDQ0291857.1 y4mF family transcriptional regulator [Oligosphaera ethanolica]NLE54843.1 helix-turn-helix transcriptional regulator [Lentisphaerota bacterium]
MNTPTTSSELGEAIRARRQELGATQKDLAMAAGTGLRFIIDLERGKPSCQTGKMLLVLQALGLSLTLCASDMIRPNETP